MYWKYHLRFPNFRTCVIVEREINWKQAEDAFKFKEHERLNEAMFSLHFATAFTNQKPRDVVLRIRDVPAWDQQSWQDIIGLP
jgi:hypothetical protein